MLLNVYQDKPYKIDGMELCKDTICIYFDLHTNRSMFYVNGTVRGYKSISAFRDALDDLAREMWRKNRKKANRKLLVFINDLDVMRMILPDGQQSQAKKRKAGQTYTLEYITEFFVFRNFNIIFNNRTQKITGLYPKFLICEGMAAFLRSLDLPLKDCRYSLAYISKKIFYKDIKAELWEDVKHHRRILRDLQTYQDMQCGNQGGALSSFEGAADIRFQLLHYVHSFDKKSAYPSYFVRDRFFPIGKIRRVVGNVDYRLRQLRRIIHKCDWFKIVIDADSEQENLRLFRDASDMERYLYGVEFWDYQLMIENGIDIFPILEKQKFRIYTTEKTGYMPDCFRKKIVELYEEKNKLPKDSAERFLIKTQLDMIYGKGLQKYDFKSDQEVFKKYLLRGENFLTPAMSMHVVSGVRHEVLKIAQNFCAETQAIDTDGLKLTGELSEIKAFFDAMNQYIIDENRKAGFDSDIGIWDYEYTAENFMQFAPKVYAYQTEGGRLVCKFAGISERHLKRYLRNIDGDPFALWAASGIHAQTCAGWYYLTDTGFFEKIVDFTIEKENEK